MNWLDTETKAILQPEDEPPLSPPKVAEFGLVLGYWGTNRERLVRAVCRINACSRSAALTLLAQPWPVTVKSDLTEEEATLGQFELVCCAGIAAVVRSEVAEQADREYLKDLLQSVSRSPEFRSVTVTIDHVPMTEQGERFVDQF